MIEDCSPWKKKKFKEIDWDMHTEVDVEIKPYRDSSGCVYRLKDGKVFTMRLKGKKRPDGQWYWYLFYLPDVKLTFDDVHSLYRARWMIEEIFREIKSSFGGDHIRLLHPISIVNHLVMVLIAYLFCKGYLQIIAHAFRRSTRGFMMDNCMKGSGRELFQQIILSLVSDPNMTQNRLRKISTAFVLMVYSKERAHSKRLSDLSKVFKKLGG
jgi:hypothetical protein